MLKLLLICVAAIAFSNASPEVVKPPSNNEPPQTTAKETSKLDTVRAMNICQSPNYIEKKWGADLPYLSNFRIFYEGMCMSDELDSLFKNGRLDIGMMRSSSPPEVISIMQTCAKRVGPIPAVTVRMFAQCFLSNAKVTENFEKLQKIRQPTILVL